MPRGQYTLEKPMSQNPQMLRSLNVVWGRRTEKTRRRYVQEPACG